MVVAGLWAAGIGPFMRSGTDPTYAGTSTPTFRQAASAAIAAADDYGHGPWSVIGGSGLQVQVTQSIDLSQSFGNSTALTSLGCNVTYPSGVPSGIEIPSFLGNRSSGLSPAWAIALKSTNGGILAASVISGKAHLEANLGFSGICASIGALITALPSDYIDSPTAAAKAMADGGAAFMTAHPDANVSMSLSAGGTIGLFGRASPPQWMFAATTCNPVYGNITGRSVPYTFNATIDAVTGDVVYSQAISSSCPASGAFVFGAPGGSGTSGPPPLTPLGTAVAFGTLSDGSSGSGGLARYYYNSTVEAANSGIVWSDLYFAVEGPTGGPASGPVTVTISDPTGSCFVATYTFASTLWDVPPTGACSSGIDGSSAPIAAGSSILMLSSSDLRGQGDTLVAIGIGTYSGQVTISIP